MRVPVEDRKLIGILSIFIFAHRCYVELIFQAEKTFFRFDLGLGSQGIINLHGNFGRAGYRRIIPVFEIDLVHRSVPD